MTEKNVPDVLLVEDNPADVFLVRDALRLHEVAVNLHVMSDGEAAIRFIEAAENDELAPRPKLALIDLNLPRKSGIEVLAHLRNGSVCGNIPVTIISSTRGLKPVEYKVDCFFTKPSDYDRFMALGGIVKRLLNPAIFS